jgi:hypothetical protein
MCFHLHIRVAAFIPPNLDNVKHKVSALTLVVSLRIRFHMNDWHSLQCAHV